MSARDQSSRTVRVLFCSIDGSSFLYFDFMKFPSRRFSLLVYTLVFLMSVLPRRFFYYYPLLSHHVSILCEAVHRV
jgi:hypothetical protein